MYHRLIRHICYCCQAPIKQFYHDSLLSRNSCHPATYILKITLCNHNFIP